MPRFVPTRVRIDRDLQAGKHPPDVAYVDREGLDHEWRGAGYATDPYKPQVAHEVPDGVQVPSFFRDLVVLAEERQRKQGTFHEPVFRTTDPGTESPPSFGWPSPDEARARLAKLAELEQRDLSTGSTPDLLRPSAPGYLIQTWGKAAAQTGTLLDVFERRPLLPGMVDVVGGIPTVKIPRLSTGATTAVQAADNAAVQELDAISTSYSAPVATIAGQEDLARQLLEFSAPGMDEVITDSLARDFGQKFDSEVVNGSASGGHTRGLLNVASILSVTGAVSSAQAFIDSVWKAFSQLAGGSGFGNPDPSQYVTLVHPRRLAWMHSGAGGSVVPSEPILPGQVVPTAGLPTNAGAGTNEDLLLVVERSNVLVLGGQPQFRVFEEVGSATQTVRISGWGPVAVLVRNPTAIAKVTGLTAPTGY